MSKQAQIKVYLQALGAHFLGQNAYKIEDIIINLICSNGTINLPYFIPNNTKGNDGKNTTTFIPGTSSFMPIITVPQLNNDQTLVTFLSRDQYTVHGSADIELPVSIELAHLAISVPTTDGFIHLRYPVLLNPEKFEYIITVTVPGLYLSLPPQQSNGKISVYVKMMCGCPVTFGPPASLWPENDFTVNAYVFDTLPIPTIYTLKYDDSSSGVKSLFSVTLSPDQKPVKSVLYIASQKSTGNNGAVRQSF